MGGLHFYDVIFVGLLVGSRDRVCVCVRAHVLLSSIGKEHPLLDRMEGNRLGKGPAAEPSRWEETVAGPHGEVGSATPDLPRCSEPAVFPPPKPWLVFCSISPWFSGSSAHGILQARILEWVAVPISRGSCRARDPTRVSCIAGRFFTV